jgi:hypothetical protein
MTAAADQPSDEPEQPPPRVTVEQDRRSTRVTLEADVPIRIELPPPRTARCEATITFEYTQRDTVVAVKGTIENGSCPVDSGDYTIAVSVRDESGELKTLQFPETWQRSDDQPLEVSAEYQIGENVDLVGVRSRRFRCVCAGTPGD